MLYPIFTYEDGTEVTASKPDADGNILLYVEKFDVNKDDFINVTFVLPSVTVQSSSGYDDTEINEMIKNYSAIKEDIIDYVKDKEKKSA